MKDDTISRKAAIDAILHNQEVYSNNFGDDPIDKYTIAIIDNDAQTIAQLPSAQPELIRCKDCKHYKTEFCAIDIWTDEVKIYKARPDDFCSRAERRRDALN